MSVNFQWKSITAKTTISSNRVLLPFAAQVAIVVTFIGVLYCATAFSQPVIAPPHEQISQDIRSINELQSDLNGIFSDPKFSNAQIGVEVRSLKNGEKLFALNAERNLLPASNLKLVTTAAALKLLGLDFRYSTQVVSLGKMVRSTLKGDLIIRGSGDPTLGSPSMFPDKDPTAIFEAWADSLDALGIEKVDGNIIADPNYFTSDVYPLGWSIEDEPYYFATQSSGISFADNAVSVTVTGGLRGGSKPLYELTPETQYFQVNDLAVTRSVPAKSTDTIRSSGNTISITRLPGENTITIQGSIDKGAEAVSEQLSVDDPPTYVATVFRETLEAHGITVTGSAMTASDLDERINYNQTHILINHLSPPLSDIVRVVNKKSHNHFAEQLLRTIGKEVLGKGDWRTGVLAVKRYLTLAGLDPEKVALYDGSGLSRMDLISPSNFVQLLKTIYTDPQLYSAFDSSLPVMGIDGTLSARLRDSRASGNVHAKTGSLTGVRSLSGYLTTKDNEPLAFSIIINNYTTPGSEVQNLGDLFLLRLVNFSRLGLTGK